MHKGRRVQSFEEIVEPGDYFGPVTGYTGDKPSVFFKLPPDAKDVPPSRAIHHVASPPHVFRECDDGSLEIRESILSRTRSGDEDIQIWHGYLDEGHNWRTV